MAKARRKKKSPEREYVEVKRGSRMQPVDGLFNGDLEVSSLRARPRAGDFIGLPQLVISIHYALRKLRYSETQHSR